jgi:hypothetical protein
MKQDGQLTHKNGQLTHASLSFLNGELAWKIDFAISLTTLKINNNNEELRLNLEFGPLLQTFFKSEFANFWISRNFYLQNKQ